MRIILCLPFVAATLLASAAAIAEEPGSTPSTSTHSHPRGQPQPVPPASQPAPQAPTTQAEPSTESQAQPSIPPAVSATQVTSAEVEAATTMPTMRPPSRETLTVRHAIRPNRPLLYTGGTILAATYATTAVLTAANVSDGNGDKTMYLPVVGPWMHLADIDESTTDTVLIAGSGVLQGVGAGLFLASFFVPEKVPAATIQAGSVKLTITPTSYGRASAGIAAAGKF